MALALWHVSRRLRRYFEAHLITVITDQPIRKIFSKEEASEKLAQYFVELGAYNITYEPPSTVKGQVLADFINEVPVGSDALVPRRTLYTVDRQTDNKEEWVLYMDGASSIKGSSAGLVLISPTKTEYTYALRLNFDSSNNQAEYEALLAGLRIAKKMKVQSLSAKVDSKLVASQINGNYEACNGSMIKYLTKAREYIECFKNFKIRNIPRNLNQKADVLSKLASVTFNHLTKEILVEVLDSPSTDECEINAVVEEEGDNWMTSIVKCPTEGVWPKDPNKARTLQMKINQYVIEKGVIFKRSYLMPMIWCVGPLQANYDIREIYMGACSMHMKARFGLPRIIVTDNGANFVNDPFKSWCNNLNIEQINIAGAHPQANGLTFRSEAVISAEIDMPTYQTMMIKEGKGNKEKIRLNLDLLQERRGAIVIREARYKIKMEHYYNKRVRLVSFKVGEYVYKRNKASRVENLGKLGPKWEGPYLVTEAYQNDSYKLRTMNDGKCHALGMQLT
ncbi:reverse transcriptase domain-containing protein [Tanacetum coccineum]